MPFGLARSQAKRPHNLQELLPTFLLDPHQGVEMEDSGSLGGGGEVRRYKFPCLVRSVQRQQRLVEQFPAARFPAFPDAALPEFRRDRRQVRRRRFNRLWRHSLAFSVHLLCLFPCRFF